MQEFSAWNKGACLSEILRGGTLKNRSECLIKVLSLSSLSLLSVSCPPPVDISIDQPQQKRHTDIKYTKADSHKEDLPRKSSVIVCLAFCYV